MAAKLQRKLHSVASENDLAVFSGEDSQVASKRSQIMGAPKGDTKDERAENRQARLNKMGVVAIALREGKLYVARSEDAAKQIPKTTRGPSAKSEEEVAAEIFG